MTRGRSETSSTGPCSQSSSWDVSKVKDTSPHLQETNWQKMKSILDHWWCTSWSCYSSTPMKWLNLNRYFNIWCSHIKNDEVLIWAFNSMKSISWFSDFDKFWKKIEKNLDLHNTVQCVFLAQQNEPRGRQVCVHWCWCLPHLGPVQPLVRPLHRQVLRGGLCRGPGHQEHQEGRGDLWKLWTHLLPFWQGRQNIQVIYLLY